jgi:hypothetical protein
MHPYHLGTKSSGTKVFGNFTVRFKQGKKLKAYKTKVLKNNNENED